MNTGKLLSITKIRTAAWFGILFLVATGGSGGQLDNKSDLDIWRNIWSPKTIDLTKTEREYVKTAGDLGNDLEGKEWETIATKYHRVYYQPSIDKAKLKQVVQCLDNLYDFITIWSPAAPQVPIKTFLVPNELARSRCSRNSKSMRTGDKGRAIFMTTSLLHEETHLFNFAYLGNKAQGWWSGEFSCIYFQERTRLLAEKGDVKKFIHANLPDGPKHSFGEIAPAANQQIDDHILGEAFSAMYFLHSTYGDEKFREFRFELLRLAKSKGTSVSDSDAAFKKVFDVGFDELNARWRRLYGWDAKKETADVKSIFDNSHPAEIARAVVAELSGPDYKGRVAGSSGEQRAGDFVAACFRRIGLKPVLPDGGFFQSFPVIYRDLVGPIGLKIRNRDFKYKLDFGILGGGLAEWKEGEMCFVGFGTNSDKISSHDLELLKGKVLVALYREKNHPNGRQLIELAKKANAIGVLLVDPPSLYAAEVYAKKQTIMRNDKPLLHVSPKVGEFILSLDNSGLTKLHEELLAGKQRNMNIPGTCRMVAGAISTPSQSRNVLGRLAPQKTAKRNILIYAHYDGQGRDGGQDYYPSANDNASGVAVMLATASLLSSRQTALKSNVCFAALGAEEVGCIGAKKFLDSKVIPWKELDLAICLDMLGAVRQKSMTVQTTNARMPAYLKFKEFVEIRHWKVKPFVRETLGSDAEVLQQSGAPTIFIITSGRKQHTVQDNAENTSPQDMAELAELLAEFIIDFKPAKSSSPAS
jgi:aminopeptidase YwaD